LILFDKENSIQDRLDLAGAIAAVTRFNEGAKDDPGVVPVREFREIRGGETRRKGNDFRAHARRASNRMAAAIKSWMSGSLR
jgi:urease beta subunit